MSKTQTKSMTLVDVDPRVRMKEVRRMVAAAHKQGKRIDLMGFTGDDIARSQIALQDLLDREKERHARARDHIVEQKEVILIIAQMTALISNSSIETLLRYQDEKVDLVQAVGRKNALLQQAEIAISELSEQNKQLTTEIEDTMNTLRIALNGNIHG